MPRFVILTHDSPVLHWDLMLEQGEILRTWRLAAPPADGQVIEAEALADHRRHYLDYEGPVSGGRGNVTRFAAGDYLLESETDRELRVRLFCKDFPATLHLQRDIGKTWSARFSNS